MVSVLFLDDDPRRGSKFLEECPGGVWVCTAQECIDALGDDKVKWDVVSLDHDLGGEIYVDSGREDCGMEVIRFLEERHCGMPHLNDTCFIVHSLNWPAAHRMLLALESMGYASTYKPFGSLDYNREQMSVVGMLRPQTRR